MKEITGISLIAFKKPDRFVEFYRGEMNRLPEKPVFELSYKMDAEYLQKVADINAPVVSAHVPCPFTDTMPNLGSRDPMVLQESLDIIEASARTVAAFGGDVVVLHSGYATDSRIYTDFSLRREHLEQEIRGFEQHILKDEGKVSGASYCDTPKYRLHMEQTINNLPRAIEVCKKHGVFLAVENLNPRITYLMQRPEDLLHTFNRVPGAYFCLDFGHLWLSSIAHKFNYFSAVEALLHTGRVLTTHMHNNKSVVGEVESISDSHLGLENGNIPYAGVFEAIGECRVAQLGRGSRLQAQQGLREQSGQPDTPGRFILETEELPVESFKALHTYLKSK